MESNSETKLTQNQKSEKKLLAEAFKGQLTENALNDLRVRFPSDIVLDMSNDEVFKQSRKDRTECNKLVDNINRRRIDFSNGLKEYGDSLISDVTGIFDNVVCQFEKEDKRRKEEAALIKLKHEQMLNKQREELKSIKDFVLTAKSTSDTDEISSLIDAVSNIEAENFHKDIVHEAIETLKDVSNQLSEILMQKIESNRLVEEAKKAELARVEAEKAAEEAKRISDAELLAVESRRKIGDRLSKLQMIPLDLMGENTSKIGRKIKSLESYEVPEIEFGDRYQEAIAAKDTVITQLKKMFVQAEQIEAFAVPDLVIEPVVENAVYVDDSLTQAVNNYVNTNAKKRDSDALSSVVMASDLIAEKTLPTLRGDIEAWATQYKIEKGIYLDLMEIIEKHNL